jgi:hypothetical protein
MERDRVSEQRSRLYRTGHRENGWPFRSIAQSGQQSSPAGFSAKPPLTMFR